MKGIYTIGNLLYENGNFLSYQSFLGKYEIATNFLTYNGCVQGVKRYAIALRELECNLLMIINLMKTT